MFLAASNQEAEGKGFRPCLRCKPDEAARDEMAVTRAVGLLKASAERVLLADLAGEVGYSPGHFQRVFKRATGLTPAAYGRALMQERVRDGLGRDDVTGAIAGAGYASASRFYEQSRERLGMTPSAWTKGGEGVTIRWTQVDTSLGPILVAATDKGVCRLSFGEGEDELRGRFPNAELARGGPDFYKLVEKVVGAVEQPGTASDIPLDVKGTAFQERIWDELRKIPAGETRTYAQLAAAAGNPKATRAAGSANGANSVAVLIPCHRVVRSDGSVGGYAYGSEIKAELLKRERS